MTTHARFSTSPRGRYAAVVAVLAALVLLLATACSSDSDSGSDNPENTVKVYAAASLKNVGDELAQAFAADGHDGVKVEYNYAGSSKLVQQIDQGGDADLFISADEENMDKAQKLDEFKFKDSEPKIVATNKLVLATAEGNPAGLNSVADLKDKQDARIAVCADGVPCGTLAHQVLDDQHITLKNPTEEANVSDVATKISTGAVDAGFIYSTDAKAGKLNAIPVDDVEPNKYPAAVTTAGANKDNAKAFLDFLQSDNAKEILAKYGFGAA
jgi:molybdate transport system substrate-binding protein